METISSNQSEDKTEESLDERIFSDLSDYAGLLFENSTSSCSATIMSTPEASSTNTLKQTPTSSKFYKNVPFPRDPVVKPITNKSYKTIHNGGIQKNITKIWNQLDQPNKTPSRELIETRIKNFDTSDCQILIGATTFQCHQIVLCCYSVYFTDLEIIKGEPINLPSGEVSPVAFVKIYEWMLATTPQVERNGIIELYKAAKFLKIKELKHQILVCFANCEVFNEDTAFSLYWEARTFNESYIQDLMLIRIYKFFLTMVATTQFQELTCKEVCSFLSLSSIGVRRETDVFYSALKWLNHNWEDRKGYAIELMDCVRFSLMLPWELADLRTNNQSLPVQKITEIPEVLAMIDAANRFVITRQWTPKEFDGELKVLESALKLKTDPRNWIKDKIFFGPSDLPNVLMLEDGFQIFLDYLKMITLQDEEYWKTLIDVSVDCIGDN